MTPNFFVTKATALFLCFCFSALPADYMWKDASVVQPSLEQGMVPAYNNGVWLTHRVVTGGVVAFFKSSDRSDVTVDCIYPSVTKIVVLSQSLNANRLGVLTVRVFSEGNRNSGGLIFLDGNSGISRLIVTEPYLLQRGIIDEDGLIWALATIRESDGKHVESDHPALVTVNPKTGARSTLLNKGQIPHSANGAHWTWGASRTYVSSGRFTAYLPTENVIVLLDETGNRRIVSAPSELGKDSDAVAVIRCGQNVFISTQRDIRHGMYRLNTSNEKWDALVWKGHSRWRSAAPRLVSCHANDSIEVLLGGNSVGTLTPLP